MPTPMILNITMALFGLVAGACTILCVAWTIPAWRRRLAPGTVAIPSRSADQMLTGWRAQLGSYLVTAGLAACAILAWSGFFVLFLAMS